MAIHCYVYKGRRKDDHYLYLEKEFDPQDLPADFPSAILDLLGPLTLVVEFDLDASRKLPQADAVHVLNDIRSRGFYLQMPKQDMAKIEDQMFS